MNALLIRPDRTWSTIHPDHSTSSSLHWLQQQLGSDYITDSPVFGNIAMWLGHHRDGRSTNPLATILVMVLQGPTTPLYGPAVLTASSPTGTARDLSTAQLTGLQALLLAMTSSPLLPRLEQAGAVFTDMAGSW